MTDQSYKEINNVPGEGDVEVELDGKIVKLRPTLKACLGISRLHNSMQKTMDQIMNMDIDTIVSIVAFGLDQSSTRSLQESVYRAGLFKIRMPLIRFITVINNGGKLPSDDDDNDEQREANEDENPMNTDQTL